MYWVLNALLVASASLYFLPDIVQQWRSYEGADRHGDDMDKMVLGKCNEMHGYAAQIYSVSPLVIYLENFLTTAEASLLVSLYSNRMAKAKTYNDFSDYGSVNKTVRDADIVLPYLANDTTLQCIIDRAMHFQGWTTNEKYENTAIQRYTTGGHFVHHLDAYDDTQARNVGGNRAATILAYLDANCTGGGTNFMHLPLASDPRWCRLVDCENSSGINGTTFKPITGNAVFWRNLKEDGGVDEMTLHSGTPVQNGTKIVMNVWSWKRFSS